MKDFFSSGSKNGSIRTVSIVCPEANLVPYYMKLSIHFLLQNDSNCPFSSESELWTSLRQMEVRSTN